MPRFVLKLLLYALPVACYGLIALGLPWYAGEFTPLRQVAVEQAASTQPTLYGRAYKDEFVAYKLISAQLRKANVLALGSSRVMQLRAGLFNTGGATFYNAGGAANNIFEPRRFVQALAAGETPQVLIVGLDQDWFHPNYLEAGLANSAADFGAASTPDDKFLLNTGRSAMADWLTGHWSPFQVLTRQDPVTRARGIGLAALSRGDGYRNDGSRQYGQLLASPLATPDRLAIARQRMRDGNSRFDYADQFSPAAITELGSFLDLCASRGITVVGFSPPYAPGIYAEMAASGHYGYIARLSDQLRQMFAARGLGYFDFSSGQLPGVTDDNFIDGFHGSEIVYTQMYVQMLDALPGVLGPYSDAAALRALLQQPRASHFQLFGN